MPSESGNTMFTIRPKEWNGGNMASTLSSGARCSTVMMSRALASRLAWLKGTALGMDSEPEVKSTAATSGTAQFLQLRGRRALSAPTSFSPIVREAASLSSASHCTGRDASASP